MSIINHNYIIVKQTISEIPNHLLHETDIDEYYTHIHILAQYIINYPNCLILPSEINDGKIFRSDIPIKLKPENDYLPEILDNITDPIWFTTQYPKAAYLNETISDEWIISCRKVKSEKIKEDNIIGYNFYVNFDGEVDQDILCNYQTEIIVKRLNKELMKLLDNVLQLFYKKNKIAQENNILIPKYKVIREYLTTIQQLSSAYSYENGTRNSSYEADRYIANIMMIIFNNLQEIYRKQPDNIFINIKSNNITILGYNAGYIRFDTELFPDECISINSEVTIQSQYLSKEVINEYFYPRDKVNSDCKTEYISLSNKSITIVGGKNINRRQNKTKLKRPKNKTKIKKTKQKKYKYNNIYMNWLTQDISNNRKVKIISPVSHPIYFDMDGKQKLLKMRTFIKENKDNMVKIVEGYNIYKNEIDYYKKILLEEGLQFYKSDK